VFEKRAAQVTGRTRQSCFKVHCKINLDVLYGKNLHDGEQANSFWTEKAGLQAASRLKRWANAAGDECVSAPGGIIAVLHGSLEKKIANAQEHLAPGEN